MLSHVSFLSPSLLLIYSVVVFVFLSLLLDLPTQHKRKMYQTQATPFEKAGAFEKPPFRTTPNTQHTTHNTHTHNTSSSICSSGGRARAHTHTHTHGCAHTHTHTSPLLTNLLEGLARVIARRFSNATACLHPNP